MGSNLAWFLRYRPNNNLDEHQYDIFSLCQKCYRYVMQNSKDKIINVKTKHWKLSDIKMLDLCPRFFISQSKTKDPDSELKSIMFDTRLKFLTACQENHYQFDSFRRAKYSSNMILNHLRNINETLKSQTNNINKKEEKEKKKLQVKNKHRKKNVICKKFRKKSKKKNVYFGK